jgi:branched-chain amino acid transport system permease protein
MNTHEPPAFKIIRATPASRIGLSLALLAIPVLAAAPWWGGPEIINTLIEVLVYIGLASLWNLLAGYAGLVSIGQQAYVGIGAYVLFSLATFWGVSPFLAIPLSGLVAALLAVPAGALLFRLRGAYFAIGSWVVAESFRLSVANWQGMGGGSGASLPAQVVVAMAPNRHLRLDLIYWLALGLSVLTLALVALVLRSRFGLALTAIRDDEVAARSNGISVTHTKFIVYVVCAFGTGMLGAVIFLARLRISPDSAFDVNDWTALLIFMTVIGGIGSIEGPIIGAIIFFLLRGALSDLGSFYLIILGAVAIVVMLFAPRGLWGLIAARTGWEVLPLQRRVVAAGLAEKDSRK